MLGTKRRKQFAMPAGKRPKYTGLPKNFNPIPDAGAKTFGRGFNPKSPMIGYRPEKKYHDNVHHLSGANWTAAAGGAPTYASVTSLVAIAQGDAMNNRTGNKICIKSISLRGEVAVEDKVSETWNAIVGKDQVTFRVLVIVDSQANGAVPSLADIFYLSSTTNPINSFNKLEETGRFKTLYDKWITTKPAIMASQGVNYHVGGSQVHYKANIKLNLPIMYGDGTSNLAAIRNNNIFYLVFCDRPAIDQLSVSMRSRVRFYDY